MFTLAPSFLLFFACFVFALSFLFKPLPFIAVLRPPPCVPVAFEYICSPMSLEAIYGPLACPFWRSIVLRPVRAFHLALSSNLLAVSVRGISCHCCGVSFHAPFRSFPQPITHLYTQLIHPVGSDQENAENRKKLLTFWGNGFSVFVSLF